MNGEHLRHTFREAYDAFNMMDRERCRHALAKIQEILEPPTRTAELSIMWVDEANRCTARGCTNGRHAASRLCWAHGGDHPALQIAELSHVD